MNIHGAALAWHDAGACVLPAAADGSKRPALAWDRYKSERPGRADVDTWATDSPGIGIVCGQVSGNVEMFEAEAAAVDDGLVGQLTDMLPVDLQQKLNTYVERSPKGGVHWIFRVDGMPVKGNTKLARRAERKPGQQTVTVLFETRGEGGWTVIAPSNGPTHPSGRPWEVLYGAPGVIPLLTADEYRLLHQCAMTFDAMPDYPVRSVAPVAGDSDGAPGQDFENQVTWGEILLPAGWTKVRHRGDVTEWVRPGKSPRDGISATTGWQGDWLYVFTTSTEFESERTYTKFGAYTLLKHGGNFSAAARDLRQRGYGAKPPPRSTPLQSVPAGGYVTDETTAAAGEQTAPTEDPPTWAPVDLTEFLDGTYRPLVPDLFRREDGFHLLYKGKVHSFHGESESGKSWLGLWAIAESLLAGGRAAMIDFESDAHTIVGRLLALGVPPDAIRERFEYRHPDIDPGTDPREQVEWQKLLTERFDVIVMDGITDALGVYRRTSVDNDEVAAWIRDVPKMIAWRTGAAVVLIDHVTKDADTRGRFAIGAQSKMANLDGAAYTIEVMEPMGIGMIGRVSMRVGKDRNGTIRPKSGPYRKGDRTQQTAIVVLDASQTGRTTVRIEMWQGSTDPETGKARTFQPTGLMERVSRQLEGLGVPQSRAALKRAVKGRDEFIVQAIDCLVADGFVIEDGPTTNGGRGSCRLVRPYRESGTDESNPFPDLDPDDSFPEAPSEVFPTRSPYRGGERGNGSKDPSSTRSGNGSGTGRERVGGGSRYTDSQNPDASSSQSEDSEAEADLGFRFPGGNELGTGLLKDDPDE